MHPEKKASVLVGVAILVTIGTSACGWFPTKSKGEKATQNDVGLAGQWRDSCTKLDWFGFAYQQVTQKFSAVGDFEKTKYLYSDENCSNKIGTLVESGTYDSLGGSTTVNGVKNINFTITKATVSAGSDDAAALLNNISYCGIETWKTGEVNDVLGKTCAGATHAAGEVVFDVYRVDMDGKRLTTGKGTLFLNKTEASARPESLDETHIYTKVE